MARRAAATAAGRGAARHACSAHHRQPTAASLLSTRRSLLFAIRPKRFHTLAMTQSVEQHARVVCRCFALERQHADSARGEWSADCSQSVRRCRSRACRSRAPFTPERAGGNNSTSNQPYPLRHPRHDALTLSRHTASSKHTLSAPTFLPPTRIRPINMSNNKFKVT